jgi:hypothetical protein
MSIWLDAAQTDPYVAPAATPPGDLYFTYQQADGVTQFLNSAAHAEGYLALGYTVLSEVTLSDGDSFRAAVSPGSDQPPADGVTHSAATNTPGSK